LKKIPRKYPKNPFRTLKSVELEMRPIYVRCESSTRGHVLVVMLAYRLTQQLARR
jgi:transposase